MRHFFIFTPLLILALITPGQAAFDAFLKLEKQGGLVPTSPTHSWVEILGFDQGTSNLIDIPGSTVGASKAEPVILQMGADQAIAEMMTGLAQGDRYELTLHLVRSSGPGSVMLELIFEDVLFEEVKAKIDPGSDTPSFNITFQYGLFRMTHTSTDNLGNSENPTATGWDFIHNQVVQVSPTLPAIGDYDDGAAPSAPDDDGDLMPNIWETQFGLNPQDASDASLDSDKDGYTNRQEFIVGTNPQEPNSFFRMTMTPLANSPQAQVQFTWTAITGRTYRLEASNSLNGDYAPVYIVTPTEDGSQQFTPPVGTGPFFRLRAED